MENPEAGISVLLGISFRPFVAIDTAAPAAAVYLFSSIAAGPQGAVKSYYPEDVIPNCNSLP